MEYKGKVALNFLKPEAIAVLIKEHFGVKSELSDKKELVNEYLTLAEKATGQEASHDKKQNEVNYKDLIISDYGITVFPESWLEDEKKFEVAYATLLENDGDDTFIRQQAIAELDLKKSPKLSQVRRKKKITKMTVSEQRKYLMKMIKVKIVRSSSEVTIPKGDMVNRKEVLPVAWGNSNISETTQVPLGIETFIHYGAFLNIKNAYKINVIVDKDSGSINDIMDENDRNAEFDITILDMPTKDELDREKMKQALREQATKH